jgi:hypothetical protein
MGFNFRFSIFVCHELQVELKAFQVEQPSGLMMKSKLDTFKIRGVEEKGSHKLGRRSYYSRLN